jgi:hypothetical protein
MARYGRDFMGRVRGMWDHLSHGLQQGHGRPQGRGGSGRPMQATGPGGEGYFLSPDMARNARYTMDYDRGWDDVGDRGFPPGGMAQFGRAGAGRGYGGDYRTGRGGSDAGEFFVNRHAGGDTGYHAGYERDLGMRRGMAAGGRGYGGDYTRGGQGGGYDRGYRGGHLDRGPRYARDYRDMDEGLRSYYSGTYREGGVIGQSSTRGGMVPPAGREHEGSGPNRTPFPRTYGR